MLAWARFRITGLRRSGAEALDAFLRERATRAGKILAVEEALLSGSFARYALRRLTAFGLARGWGAALHVVEATWLASVFSARQFVASLALQNATLVVDALYFGALEGMRRRARELGPGSAASALTTRWLTVAIWLGVASVLAPAARAAWLWGDADEAPSLFHVYALICAMRLGADVVFRTYYSGVFAFYRVYRPLVTPLVGPTTLVVVTLALWESLQGWSFPVGLAASTIASRGMLFFYTRRAYRQRRIPPPRLRLRPRWGRGGTGALRDGVLAGLANTTTRLGSVVLIAAVVPSLSEAADLADEAPILAPFAYAMHLAAPLLFISGQWGLVFYHDWKRLERDAANAIARHLHWRLLATALLVAVLSWALGSGLVCFWLPWSLVWPALVALAPAMVGLSIWTALQLRSFAHGEFLRQVAAAAAMLLALWIALSSELFGTISWYLALAAGPWAAIGLYALLTPLRRKRRQGQLDTVADWTRALSAVRGQVGIWEAQIVVRPAEVVTRVAVHLGQRGAVVRSGRRVIFFERGPRLTPRIDWLRATGGTLARLEGLVATSGAEALARLEQAGRLGRPRAGRVRLAELEAAFLASFPEGFVLHVGRRPPSEFLALAPVSRQAIWRDAVRAVAKSRNHSRWFVTTYAPEGAAEAAFATPRPITAEQGSRWRKLLESTEWRILSPESAVEPSPAGSGATGREDSSQDGSESTLAASHSRG